MYESFKMAKDEKKKAALSSLLVSFNLRHFLISECNWLKLDLQALLNSKGTLYSPTVLISIWTRTRIEFTINDLHSALCYPFGLFLAWNYPVRPSLNVELHVLNLLPILLDPNNLVCQLI